MAKLFELAGKMLGTRGGPGVLPENWSRMNERVRLI
jgi:hypothetical protein